MAADGEGTTAVSPETIRRWESGDRIPAAQYRKHLVILLDQTAEQLGILSREEMTAKPDNALASRYSPDRVLISGLIAETVRNVLAMIHHERRTNERHDFIRNMLNSTAAPDNESDQRPFTHGAATHKVDRHPAAEFDRVTDFHRLLYLTTDANILLDAVLPHLRLGIDLLIAPRVESIEFRALARSVSLTALLAARMAFFDLGNLLMANDCFTLATRAVEQSGDHALSAVVRAYEACGPGYAGNVFGARALLDIAYAHARNSPGPRLRSWLHCVSGEIAARNGDVQSGLNHIRQAEHALSTQGEDPTWLDFFDRPQWAAFAGEVCLLAGKKARAVTHLQHALSQLSQRPKQRSTVMLDLATAQAPDDPPMAAALAHEALDVLEAIPYAAAMARVGQVAQALHGTRFAAEIRDRIRNIAPTGI